jgi:hypothetical protein
MRDVTDQVDPIVTTQSWCTSRGGFLFRVQGDERLMFAFEGSSSLVPKRLEDFVAHPTDWFMQPEYKGVYERSYAVSRGEVLAVVPAGARFWVRSVMTKRDAETGRTYHPMLAFEGDISHVGEADGILLLASTAKPPNLFSQATGIEPCEVAPFP